jgi:hypothetical protein
VKPVVIRVSRRDTRADQGHEVELREAPISSKGIRSLLRLRVGESAYSLLGGPTPGMVRRCGRSLGIRLAANRDIKEALEHVATQRHTEEFQIFIEVGPPELENLPWEAIWRRHLNFLALHPAAPIARRPSYINNGIPAERYVEPRLRVLAVLSASGVDPEGEWRQLAASLAGHGDRYRLKLFVSDERLAAEIGRAADPRVTCHWVPGSPATLIGEARAFRPNVLHFFCHGRSTPPSLELLTRSQEPVCLPSSELAQLSGFDALWLVTLNCCEGGQSSGAMYSIARELSDAGVAAVVAMREGILSTDANIFTGAFYGDIVPSLVRLLPPSAGPADIPESILLNGLRAARQRLYPAPRTADDSPEWTFPILYLRRSSIRLKPRPEPVEPSERAASLSPRDQATVYQIASLRAFLSDSARAGAPMASLRETIAKIDELEATLPGKTEGKA